MAPRKRAPARTPLEAWFDDLPDAFTDCRDLGHLWRPHDGGRATKWSGWFRVLLCSRCNTERTQEIDGYGHVMANRYRYASGYQTPKGSDPVSRDTFRLSVITRDFGK